MIIDGRRPGGAGSGSADGRPAHSNSITQPQVMPMSATLNTGQNWRSTKSTTAPRSRPGARNTRSARLPTRPAEEQAHGDGHRQRGTAAAPETIR